MLKDELPKIVTQTVPGPKAAAVLARRRQAIPDAIGTIYPTVIKRGEGAMFEDVDGNYFLDWVGGVGVLNIGYSQPEVVKAVQDQAGNYFHAMANIVTHEGYVALAEKLNAIAPVRGEKKRSFFINSGAEADENAVKVAKAYTKRPNIIVFSGAFHGRTLMTMAMTAKKAYARGMGPFPDGVYRAEFPYLYRKPAGMSDDEALEFYMNSLKEVFMYSSPAEYVAAIVVEPLQGEGGFIPAPIEWVKAVRKICDDNGILLIADEVQCGNCRTGKYFASEYWAEAGAAPDIVTTAKSLAGGMPISAITGRAEVMDAAPQGTIGGTFCGNPLSCASGIAAMKIYKEEDFPAKARHIGELVTAGFKEMQKKYSVIGDIRGLGAMIGVEFVTDRETKEPATKLVARLIQEALQRGLLMESAGTSSNVIRFLAPLVMTDEQTKRGLEIFEESLKAALAE